ncbi:DUF6760 family protein, partial [Moorena sp. SIO3B2]|uniref:DUF6760 family protein n=1 Tax=Moorena sp. SIO3B2 TaxID=2607827 RepID=UPI00338DFB83
GGVTCYPSERLLEEVAYIAYHLHWSYDQIMSLDHQERQRWVAEVASINEKLNEQVIG